MCVLIRELLIILIINMALSGAGQARDINSSNIFHIRLPIWLLTKHFLANYSIISYRILKNRNFVMNPYMCNGI
jgi:hypothetical protein